MTNKKEEINFESALTELEKIVLNLDDDSISLEESVQSFGAGIELVKQCQTQLEEEELKVNKLLDDGSLEESDKT